VTGTCRGYSAAASVVRAAIIGSVVLGLLAPPGAQTQELTLRDVITVRPSFEYEQCANACQIDVDRTVSACMNDALVTQRDVDGACMTAAIDNNNACLKSCPVDTGDKRARGEE
jgi:hypothetical protein